MRHLSSLFKENNVFIKEDSIPLTKVVRLDSSEKNMPLPKRGVIILIVPYFGQTWLLNGIRCHIISCAHFYFLFRINVRKRYLNERAFHHCYGNFFERAILKYHSYIQRSFSSIVRHNDNSIYERHPKLEDLLGIDQNTS